MKLSEIKSNWSLLNYFIDLSNFDGFVNLNITADRQDIKERVDTILGGVFKKFSKIKIFNNVAFKITNHKLPEFSISSLVEDPWLGIKDSDHIEAATLEYMQMLLQALISSIRSSTIFSTMDIAGKWENPGEKYGSLFKYLDETDYIVSPTISNGIMAAKDASNMVDTGILSRFMVGERTFYVDAFATMNYMLPIPKKIDIILGQNVSGEVLFSEFRDPSLVISNGLLIQQKIEHMGFDVRGTTNFQGVI